MKVYLKILSLVLVSALLFSMVACSASNATADQTKNDSDSLINTENTESNTENTNTGTEESKENENNEAEEPVAKKNDLLWIVIFASLGVLAFAAIGFVIGFLIIKKRKNKV